MALWSNTSDGWAKDPSSAGNGALASYLQTSTASSPKSQSATQTQDPSNSTPTSSIARTVIPATPTATPTTQVVAQPVVQALTTPVAQAVVPQTVSRVAASIAPDRTFAAPTAVVSPSTGFTGPTVLKQGINLPGQSSNSADKYSAYAFYINNPTTGQTSVYYRKIEGTGGLFGSGYHYSYTDANGNNVTDPTVLAAMNNDGGAATVAGAASGSAATDLQNASNTFNNQAATYASTYAANQSATLAQNQSNLKNAQDSQLLQTFLDYATSHGGQLPTDAQAGIASNSLDNANIASIRAAALEQYQLNAQDAAKLNAGPNTVDTSTQDAANQASLAALSSRFSTNLMGNNIAAQGRAYAGAVADQTGVNQQLSDEDYAARYDQNQAAFQSAVSNQATVDANATGTKLQSDINAIGDAIGKLSVQVSNLNTQSGQAVQGSLTSLQDQINKYNEYVQNHANNTAYAIGLAKGIFSGVAALTATAVNPAAGAAVGAATT